MNTFKFKDSDKSSNTEIAEYIHSYGMRKKISIWVERHKDTDMAQETHNGVTILCPGWVELGKSLDPLRRTFAEMGHTAITLHHPQPALWRPDQAIFTSREDRVKGIIQAMKIASQELADPENLSMLGHSMGGTDQTRAVLESDLEITPLVMTYAGSAGMNPTATFGSVARGIMEEVGRNEIRGRQIGNTQGKKKNHTLWRVVGYALSNPNSAIAQGYDAANHYVGRHLGEIAGRGTVLVDIMATDDLVFKPADEFEYKQKLPFDVREILPGPDATHNMTTYMPDEVSAIHLDAIKNAEDIITRRLLGETALEFESELMNPDYR